MKEIYYNFVNVHFTDVNEASRVFGLLKDTAEMYGVASVNDLYLNADVSMARDYKDSNYGWTLAMLDSIEIIKDMMDESYKIDLPTPSPFESPLEEETNFMSTEIFKALLEELDGNSVKTLAEKNARYSQNGDALHNFRSGADIAGGTPAQACWGYLTKHLIALRDKVKRNDFSDREDFLEKCQDSINYIRFLWCIGSENYKKESNNHD